jgi:hypothetical protein
MRLAKLGITPVSVSPTNHFKLGVTYTGCNVKEKLEY